MKIRLIGALLILLFNISAKALETDQFVVWDKTLRDSRKELNKFIQNGLNQEIQKINKENKKYTCEAVAQRILKFNLISFRYFRKLKTMFGIHIYSINTHDLKTKRLLLIKLSSGTFGYLKQRYLV